MSASETKQSEYRRKYVLAKVERFRVFCENVEREPGGTQFADEHSPDLYQSFIHKRIFRTMTAKKLHAHEFDIDAALVARLVQAQFPKWAHLPVRPLDSLGTVHVLYRLGDDKVVRLPRVGVSSEEMDKEHLWLPRLASLLPVAIPLPLGRGEPTPEYPCEWSVYSWLEGENPEPGALTDPVNLARDLAAFVTVLHNLDSAGAPESERGRRSLKSLDASARAALEESPDLIDTEALQQAWESALRSPAWDGRAVWVHADLGPGNLLVKNGRLSAVIDFGSLGTGDPASDLTVAWSVLPLEARRVFREALNVDDATWQRARGLALVIALQALPYYLHSNPTFAGIARHTLVEILAEHEASG